MPTTRSALLGALAGTLLTAATAQAQIIRPGARAREAAFWVSGTVGLFQQQGLVDGTTGSTWEFSDAFQGRVSLERAIGTGSTVGIAGSVANTSLRYTGESCGQCDASARVTQLLAIFRGGGGGGAGLHQVLEISVGVIGRSEFRAEDDSPLAPMKPDYDPTFAIGYGIGFPLSPRLHLTLVQEASTSLHQREGLGAGERRATQQYTTRIGARFGLGSR